MAQTFTTSQIVSELKNSKVFQTLMEEGLSVTESKDKITFTGEDYQLEATLDGSILTIPATITFDTYIEALLYDTISRLYGSVEGEKYGAYENFEEYTLDNQGLEFNGLTLKIDVSKQPLPASETYDLDEFIEICKTSYIRISNPDYLTEEEKRLQAVEATELFVENMITHYYELYANGKTATFEQLIKLSTTSSSPTNCTGSISTDNGLKIVLNGCKVDSYTCSYNSTDNAVCK
jgi:hypothetical protein